VISGTARRHSSITSCTDTACSGGGKETGNRELMCTRTAS
jgi:hypothetical protein